MHHTTLTHILTATVALAALAGCATNDSELDRQKGSEQRCFYGPDRTDCCGHVVSERGFWSSPMVDRATCDELTSNKGVYEQGVCRLECEAGELIVELNPRARPRALGCVMCSDR